MQGTPEGNDAKKRLPEITEALKWVAGWFLWAKV